MDRSQSLSIQLSREILSFHMKDIRRADRISRHLNSAYPSHNYPITIKEAKKIGLKVKPLNADINRELIDLNLLYSEMGQRAYTDYDEENYHDNEILNILEWKNVQIFYQTDKDWHYRKEERRYVPMHDSSSWRLIEHEGNRMKNTILHVR